MNTRRPPNNNRPGRFNSKQVSIRYMNKGESEAAIETESDKEWRRSTDIEHGIAESPGQEHISRIERFSSTNASSGTRRKRKIEEYGGEGHESVEMSTLAKKCRVIIDNQRERADSDEDEDAANVSGIMSATAFDSYALYSPRLRIRSKAGLAVKRSNEPSGSSDGLPPPYPVLRFHFPWAKLKAQTLREIVVDTLGMPFVGNKKRSILRLNQVQTDGLEKAIEYEQEHRCANAIASTKSRLQKATAEQPSSNLRRSKRKRSGRRGYPAQTHAVTDEEDDLEDRSASGSSVQSVFAPAQIETATREDLLNIGPSQRGPAVGPSTFQENPVVTGDPDDVSYSSWSPFSKQPPRMGNIAPLPPTNWGNSYQSNAAMSSSHSLERVMSPRSPFVASYFSIPQLSIEHDDTTASRNLLSHIAGGYNTAHSSTWTNSGLSEAVSSKNEFDDIAHLLPGIIEAPRGSKEYNTIASFVLFEVSINPNLEKAINAARTPDMKKEMIRLMLKNRKPAMALIEG
ncbi:hypothetical protein BDZ89DRAFT_1054676 [Hymenopellis radicata]|nr:hypothetical protein BDZ89DRAFT_1054676 [Hymenopellis radicata]